MKLSTMIKTHYHHRTLKLRNSMNSFPKHRSPEIA